MSSSGNPLHTNHRDHARPVNVISPLDALWLTLYCGIPRGVNNAYIDGHVEWISFDRLDQGVYFWGPSDISYHWPKN